MSDSDIDEIKSAKVKLEEDSQALFSKLYEQAQAAGAGMGGQAGPDMGSAAGPDMNQDSSQDDVVDGDYREV